LKFVLFGVVTAKSGRDPW